MKVEDIANFFLTKEGITNKKLQKLCYYAQAWYYALYNQELFTEKIEAWVHGPVIPELYNKYSNMGYNEIEKNNQIPKMDDNTRKFLDQIWNIYGDLDGDQLEALTHREDPWINARHGLDPKTPSNNIILLEDMGRYYREKYNV